MQIFPINEKGAPGIVELRAYEEEEGESESKVINQTFGQHPKNELQILSCRKP